MDIASAVHEHDRHYPPRILAEMVVQTGFVTTAKAIFDKAFSK